MFTPPTPYRLRPMTKTDLAVVYQLDKLSFPTPARKGIFEHELDNNEIAYYQVLTEDDLVIGFAGYWLLADEIHVSTIAIHPEKRRRHLGELLLLYMMFKAYTHPANIVTLEVRRSNEAAQKLYEKYRFAQVGVRRRYYKDTGEDALLMTVTALDASYRQFLESQRNKLFETLSSEVSRP